MSVADELRKLASLRDEGILSEDEFQAQKSALMRSTETSTSPVSSGYEETPEAPSKISLPKWESLPVSKKWWFQALITLLIIPIGLILMMAQKAYFKKRDGTVAKRSVLTKLLFGLLAVFVWVFNIAAIMSDGEFSSISQSTVASCDSSSAKSVLADAIENNANANVQTLRLLDLREIELVRFDKNMGIRKCNATFVLNSGTDRLGYELSMTSDNYLLVEISEPHDRPLEKDGANRDVAYSKPVIEPTEGQGLELLSQGALGLNMDYVQQKIGPPKRVYGDTREYEIDGCAVYIEGSAAVGSISFSADCPSRWTMIIPNWRKDDQVSGTTVGSFVEETPAGVLGGCFRSCGNAADPELRMGMTGSRADGFIEVIVSVTIAGDDALDAMNLVESKIRDNYSESEFEELYDLADVSHPDLREWTISAFKDVEIDSVEFGYQLFEQ